MDLSFILTASFKSTDWSELSLLSQRVQAPLGSVYDFKHYRTEDLNFEVAFKMLSAFNIYIDYPPLETLTKKLKESKVPQNHIHEVTKIPRSSLRHLRLGNLKTLRFKQYLNLCEVLNIPLEQIEL